MKIEYVEFSNKELDLLEAYAAREGLTLNEAATRLISEAIEKRMGKSTRRRPAKNILKFRTKGVKP